MNKITYILFLFFCLNGAAQDSLAIAEKDSVKEVLKFTEKDILVDDSQISPRSFSKDLKQKYEDDGFVYEEKAKEKNLWDRFKEWLAYWFEKIFGFGSNKVSMAFVELFLKIFAVIVIIIVIYMIVKAIMNDEGRWIFGKSSDKKVINYDEIEKNLHLVDFEKLIKEALKSGDNRLTIRYYYLWLLKKLAAKEIIEWDVEKTNSDYLYEIKSEKLKGDFAYLSYLYNYIWYGEFDLEEETLAKAVKAFQKTIQTL